MVEKTYSELVQIPSFVERYRYLQLHGVVAEPTFGWKRYLNQVFYKTDEWKAIRNAVIIRDMGCDLGVSDREIHDRIYIHHMNPITDHDIIYRTPYLLDPEYLITTTHRTHNAIHYGDENLLDLDPVMRQVNDTIPWR